MPDSSVLVSDFDGTITRHDYYRLLIDHLIPPDAPDSWGEYLAGRLSHFEALKRTYAAADAGEAALVSLLDQMEPDPELSTEVRDLERSGWRIVVASAGCRWYIDPILERAGVSVEVHANPGRITDGRLVMELPVGSPFFSTETGIDKVAIVRHWLARGVPVAYAGDGLTDVAPARLVPPPFRFARSQLASELRRLGEPFQPFDRWADIARALR